VETRLRALERTLKQHGSIDVLFIGSSVFRTNIQPLTFDREIGFSGIRIVSFNGGLSGLVPDQVSLYFEKFWLRHVQPKIVIQAIRYPELKSKTTVQTSQSFQSGMLERLWISKKFIDKINALAIENIRILYYAGTLTETLRYFELPLNHPRGYEIDERGYNKTHETLTEVKAAGLLDDEQGYSTNADTENFSTGIAALKRNIELCRRHDIQYVLINMPEHSFRWVSQPGGDILYASYLRQLDELAYEEGIIFIDLTYGDPDNYSHDEWFSDYHHMSPLGAELFSRELAKFFIIHSGELFSDTAFLH